MNNDPRARILYNKRCAHPARLGHAARAGRLHLQGYETAIRAGGGESLVDADRASLPLILVGLPILKLTHI